MSLRRRQHRRHEAAKEKSLFPQLLWASCFWNSHRSTSPVNHEGSNLGGAPRSPQKALRSQALSCRPSTCTPPQNARRRGDDKRIPSSTTPDSSTMQFPRSEGARRHAPRPADLRSKRPTSTKATPG
uniref:Uncharacterized protein n=1 Tax=Micrurus lemniscatus lemniscatus TaxID=129467 RepID=A0A2D4IBV6_MICLE